MLACHACGHTVHDASLPCPACGAIPPMAIAERPHMPTVVVEHALRPIRQRPWALYGFIGLLALAGVIVLAVFAIDQLRIWSLKREAKGMVNEATEEITGTPEEQREALAMAAKALKAHGIVALSAETKALREHDDWYVVGRGRTRGGGSKKVRVHMTVATWGDKRTWDLEMAALDDEVVYVKPEAKQKNEQP